MTYIRRLTAAVVVAFSMVALAACGVNEARSLLSSIESVSYTHLTLPTILLV